MDSVVSSVLYDHSVSVIAGELHDFDGEVKYRDVLTRMQKHVVFFGGTFTIVATLMLAAYVLLPSNYPARSENRIINILAFSGLLAMVMLQIIAAMRAGAIMYHARRVKDPVPIKPDKDLRVAVLTTIVPDKEPVELVMSTLRAMKRIAHDGVLDVWLLDEGNDPKVRSRCEAIGVKHFSRKDVPEWNTQSGPFRARTKHGNHNAWRAAHEDEYDVVAQMDPDHVPFANFLERTLGYFCDPDVAFVVAPQVYGNLDEAFVARGSAELAYLFHGIIQRGANGNKAPLLIGTNHLYRPKAFTRIDGYQDSIIEDHLTAMVLYTSTNPDTNNGWKGVYTPDIVSVGEGPATYTDFFSQQKRWAYGIWQIARHHSPRLLKALPYREQAASFIALQLHYPTLALTWLAGVYLSSLYLIGGITFTRLPVAQWASLFAASIIASLAFNQYLRRFNLAEHERKGVGLAGIILDLVTAPIYVSAAAAQLVNRPLSFVVTPKGSLTSGDGPRTFRIHAVWAAFAFTAIVIALYRGHSYPALYVWMSITAAISMTPIVHSVAVNVRRGWAERSLKVGVFPVRSQRMVGEVLVDTGVITPDNLAFLLDLQKRQTGPWRRLGEIAVREGFATRDQIETALLETLAKST